MAKYDSHSSRSAALERDDAQGEVQDRVHRPTPFLAARAPRLEEIDPAHNPARVWHDSADDSVEDGEEDAFLRARRRVPVRRGRLPKSRAGRILLAIGALLGLAALAMFMILVRNFFRSDPRFRIDSSSHIQIAGNSQVTRQQLLAVFGSDIGRNIFFVPLAERQAELEKLPWVAHATVMRLLPNQLRVAIVERIPIAFLRTGSSIGLVDAEGVMLSLPPAAIAAKHYSFPVVTGLTARDPLPLRAARVRLYTQFIADLDSGGTRVSAQLSEVDLSDPEDIRALLPANGSDILVHFGEGDFLNRYRRYKQHLAEWMRQYPHLTSVDMRFDNQVVLEMDKGNAVAADNAEAPVPPASSERTPPRQAVAHASATRAGSAKRAKSGRPPSRSTNRKLRHNAGGSQT